MALEREPIDDLDQSGKLPDESEVSEDAQEQEPVEGEALPKGPDDEAGEAAADAADEGDDAGEDDDEGDGEEPAPQKRRRPGKAARKITRLEAENQTLRERMARLEGLAEAGKAPDAKPASEPQAPREEDFEDRSDFILAQAKHEARLEARREIEAERTKADETKRRQDQAAIEARFTAQVADAHDKYDDYGDTARNAGPYINDIMLAVIADSDVGAEIIYDLGKNLAEAQRIAALTPQSQVRELGKIEARLEKPAGDAPPPKKPTAAPDPPKKLKPGTTVAKSLEDMSPEEYDETRRKQMAAARR